MDRFRVLSDIHLDVNDKYPLSIGGNDVFTVVAGDTSGHAYLVDAKCDNPNIGIKVENARKAGDFFRGLKRPRAVYDAKSDKWFCAGRELVAEDSGIVLSVNGTWDDDTGGVSREGRVSDGDTVYFSVKSADAWLRKNAPNGILVAGNHLVYNRDGYSIEELKRMLGRAFPPDCPMTFLDQSIGVVSKEVDGILFVGTTLYTDYRLPQRDHPDFTLEQTIEHNKRWAQPKMSGGGLNDFNFGRTEECTYNKAWYLEGDSDLSYITPTNYERFFHRSFEAIKAAVEANPDKDVVVVTHHCPSPKCISSRYVDSELNASYVSDLEGFIESHGNIRCWVCGHVHHRASFRVGNCLVVMNPLGYCKYGEYLASEGGWDWTPNAFVNTKTWELEMEPFDLSKWDKTRKKAERERAEWLKKYGGIFF